jgi:hypothetical protein
MTENANSGSRRVVRFYVVALVAGRSLPVLRSRLFCPYRNPSKEMPPRPERPSRIKALRLAAVLAANHFPYCGSFEPASTVANGVLRFLTLLGRLRMLVASSRMLGANSRMLTADSGMLSAGSPMLETEIGPFKPCQWDFFGFLHHRLAAAVCALFFRMYAP